MWEKDGFDVQKERNRMEVYSARKSEMYKIEGSLQILINNTKRFFNGRACVFVLLRISKRHAA